MTAFAPSVREVLAMTLMVSTPHAFDGRPMRVDPFRHAVVQDDPGAGPGQPDGDRSAHGAAGTGDDGDLASKEAFVIERQLAHVDIGPFSVNHLSDYEC